MKGTVTYAWKNFGALLNASKRERMLQGWDRSGGTPAFVQQIAEL